MKELIVTEREDGMRLDRYLERYLCAAGKNFIYKMMRRKNITLNGRKCAGNEKLAGGDRINIFFSDDTLAKFTETQKKALSDNAGVTIVPVYEDDDIIIADKPAGMLSQKAGRDDISLVEHITDYLISSGQITREELRTFHPGICNRLDRNTSGLVVAGKTAAGLREMSQAFRDRTIHKYYICIVKGVISREKRIEGFLAKDADANRVVILENPRAAEGLETPPENMLPICTRYIPVASTDKLTLLKVELITGRTHQIRAHLAAKGHPVVGDLKYGDKEINAWASGKYRTRRQLLHAYELDYPARSINVRTEVPEEFKCMLEGENIWERGIQEDLEALH